jgi:hypothetical protein
MATVNHVDYLPENFIVIEKFTKLFLSAKLLTLTYETYVINCKGKAIPLQPSTGPEGSSRLRLSDFKTIGT